MTEKDSALVKIVAEPQPAGYRDNAKQSAEPLFLQLRETHPEWYDELMRLAKAELVDTMIVREESKFNWPTYLQNQVEVEAYGLNYVYVGEAMDFWFSGNGKDIRGNAKLTKLQKNKTIKKSWKLFPPRIETRVVEKYETIWTVRATEWNGKYLLCDGGRGTGVPAGHSFHYRGALHDKLLENKIKLPGQLFEQIFAPIDAEILRIYQKLKKE